MSQTDILTTNRTDGAINTGYIYEAQSAYIYNTIFYICIYILKLKLLYV